MSDSQEDLARAFRAGVRGYLLKDMDPDDVIDAIRRTARGEVVVAPTRRRSTGSGRRRLPRRPC
jgi:two-component system nitrate/nitrite response regulator NarL